MNDKDAKYELMYAYALGCLNEDEVLNFKEITISDENFIWDELGEFQNLTALMASILSVEMPEPEVKNKVAQKLYNLKDENVLPVQQEEDTKPDDQIFESSFDKEKEEIHTEEAEDNSIVDEPVLDNESPIESIEQSLYEDENKIEEYSKEVGIQPKEIPDEEKQEMEVQNEREIFNEDLSLEEKSVTENKNENINLNEEISFDDETQGIEIHSENEPHEEVHIEDIENTIEQNTEENEMTEENNNPFELDDDFLPKRKEPEKFRFEEKDDDEQQEKVSQEFIEKFIEHNKSSITEKIDQTIDGVKEQIGNEPEIDDSGYELVQPLSKTLSILESNGISEKRDELDENLIEHNLGEDSLKSQELQRVYIQKSGSRFSIIILIILSILFLGAAVYFYLNYKKITDTSDRQINQLKNDSAALISSKHTSRAVISFLESPNVKVVELGPTDASPNSSGKLYINFAAGAGYLFTKDLPVLASNKSLQLWLTDGSRFISLGVVATKGDDEYYPFAFKHINSPGSTEILITEENSGGAKQPSSRLLLIGALE